MSVIELKPPPFRVLMICTGNICRSPTAEGVFRAQIAAAGLSHRVAVDSAGTHGYHVGEPPDPRSVRHALKRGIDLSALRARRVDDSDFADFDLLLAMDRENFAELERRCPSGLRHKLVLFMVFAPDAHSRVVPDPYYGAGDDFEEVLDLVEQASQGLVADLRARIAQSGSTIGPNARGQRVR